MVVRNPFAVALSKYKKRDWTWMTNPDAFLRQEYLYNDHLQPFEGVIRNVGDDFIERQVLIWAIIHHVPFLQFQPQQVHVIFYEDIVERPEHELLLLFRYLRPWTADCSTRKALEILHVPSRVTGCAKDISRIKPSIDQWKKELSAEQIRNGMKILSYFGLENLYDDNSRPRKDVIEKFPFAHNNDGISG